MYGLKPILVDQKISLPTCMFKLKPVNPESSEDMQDSINNSVSEEILSFFIRQQQQRDSHF